MALCAGYQRLVMRRYPVPQGMMFARMWSPQHTGKLRALPAGRVDVRNFFAIGKLQKAREMAEKHPRDANYQAAYMTQLVQRDPRAAVRRFQSQKYASNDMVVREYVLALTKTGAIDRMSLKQVLHYVQSTGGKNAGVDEEVVRSVMTDKLHIVTMKPARSASQMIWKALRGIGVAVLCVSAGAGLMGEERQLPGGKTSVHKEYEAIHSSKTFADVKGAEHSKKDLEELVEFLKDPRRFTRLGGKLPKGYLLVGPPGTGKTLLAKAVAGEAGVPFLYASGSDFDELYVGLGAKRIRSLFAAAKERAPCIVFIDEIDAVGGKRSGMDQSYARMSLNQLLVEMDGFDQTDGLIMIAATNFPELLDPALVRPGRIDQTVTMDRPDVGGREEILEHYVRKVPLGDDVDIPHIARGCSGMVGADIENLVNTAALFAAGRKRNMVTAADFDEAKDKITMGPQRKSLVRPAEQVRRTAYHEGGHALVAAFTPGARDIRKATVLPRGRALGFVDFLEYEDQGSMSRRQMVASIDVAMGGRVAEELIFGPEHVTTGASQDLAMATSTARRMVMLYGMSDKLGMGFKSEEDWPNLSPEQQKLVDLETKVLLDDAYTRVERLMKQKEGKLHSLATALLDKENMSGYDVYEALGAPVPKSIVELSTRSPHD